MNPSTTVLATRSRPEMPASTVGSRNRCSISYEPGSALRRGVMIQEFLQQIVLRQAVGFGFEVQQNAVTKNRTRQRDDVFVRHMVAMPHQRSSFRGEHQELRRAHAGAEVYVVLHEIGRGCIRDARRA